MRVTKGTDSWGDTMGKIISKRTAAKLVREGKAEIVRDGVVLMEDKRYQVVNRLDACRVDHYKL